MLSIRSTLEVAARYLPYIMAFFFTLVVGVKFLVLLSKENKNLDILLVIGLNVSFRCIEILVIVAVIASYLTQGWGLEVIYRVVISIIATGLLFIAAGKSSEERYVYSIWAYVLMAVGLLPEVLIGGCIPATFVLFGIVLLVLWLVGLPLKLNKTKGIVDWQLAVALLIVVLDGSSLLNRLGL